MDLRNHTYVSYFQHNEGNNGSIIIGKKFLHYAKIGHFEREKIEDKCREDLSLDELHAIMEEYFGISLSSEEKEIDLFFRMSREGGK